MDAAQKIETFENIPESGLNNITSATIKEVSADDIFKTADIADSITDNNIPREKKGNVSANKDAQTTPTKLGGLVGGELGVRLLDAAVPALIVTLIGLVGYSFDKGKLKLNADDRKVIAPLMQDALNAIEIDFSNPFINLAFGLSIVYGAKIIEEIPNMKRKGKTPAAKVIQMNDEKPPQQTVTNVAPPASTLQDVEYDFSSVANFKPAAKIAPEFAFKADFDELVRATMNNTGRKSRRGAISYLYQFDRDAIKTVLDRYGFKTPPNDKDFDHVQRTAKNIDFNL